MPPPPHTIEDTLAELVEEFEVLGDWEERYRYVIELGREVAPLTDAERSEHNKVRGCASQVWLVTETTPDETLTFRGDSDAHIVKGLIAILLRLYSDQRPEEIARIQRGGRIFKARPGRRAVATALERPGVDGRAHQARREGRARLISRSVLGAGAALGAACGLTAALAEAHLLGQFRTRLGVVRSDHRVILCQTPLGPIVFRAHVVLGAQVPLE